VSKEDRFIDDFDRSWPKSKPSPTSSVPDFPVTSPALSSRGTSAHDLTHPHLFNERSNRLEPYGHSPRMGQSVPHNRRGSHNDGSVQLLQKVGNGEVHSRSRTGLAPGFIGDRRDGGSRKDHPSSPRLTRHDWGHHEMSPSASLQGGDREPSERGRRSDMGPPPVPLHATRRLSQESGRQLPPRFSPNAALPRRLPSRDRENRFPLPSSPHSSRFGPPSPALSHASTLVLSPSALSGIGLPGADLDEVTKDLMQSAAARAKARKQQEEAEREAQKERARRKAAELEEKLKAAEAEKHKEVESVSKEEETKIAVRLVFSFSRRHDFEIFSAGPGGRRIP
jgi:serine/arginine repetitive matrix protein 2